MKIHNDITELIGSTPLVKLERFMKDKNAQAQVVAKLEYFNPAGSVKDRAALYMIEDAQRQGLLKEGSVIIEPTSGNTGIGLAAVAATKGYKVILTMPDTMSAERRQLLAAYGAEIVLTPGAEGIAGAVKKAQEIAEKTPNSFIAGQFENSANAMAHFDTTGPEILRDTDGNIDILVAGVGTGGTITGTGKFLKSKLPNIKVVAVEPASSPVLSGGKSGAHAIQGIGAGFIPEVLDTSVYDEVVTVENEKAIEIARYMGHIEGFLVGISSGAALSAAIEIGKREENKDKNIVVILPDSGSRYLSTELYEFL